MIIQLISIPVGLFLLLFVLPKAWETTVLGSVRDELFDLREDLRQHFIDTGRPLDHPLYINLRSLLNSYIRFLEINSIWWVIGFQRSKHQNPDDLAILNEEIENLYKTKHEDLKELTAKTRKKSVELVQTYMVTSSLWFLIVVLMFTLIEAFAGKLNNVIGNIPKTSSLIFGKMFKITQTDFEESSLLGCPTC